MPTTHTHLNLLNVYLMILTHLIVHKVYPKV